MAVSKVNQACTSSDQLVKKGAEIVLALLPSMLLRASSAAERLASTRVKMGTRFGKFFAGDFLALIEDTTQSSVRSYEQQGIRVPRSHVFSEETHEENMLSTKQNVLLKKATSRNRSGP